MTLYLSFRATPTLEAWITVDRIETSLTQLSYWVGTKRTDVPIITLLNFKCDHRP